MVRGQKLKESSAPSSTTKQGLRWLARDLDIGVGLFVLALATRVLHFRQISTLDPYFLSPAVDGAVYHAWAQQIANGDWLGQGAFIMGPLYPYLMGALYSWVGPDLAIWKMLQAWLGAGSCVLLWWLAKEVFDRRVALLAGLFSVFYEMLIFYGGTVMVVNVQVPLVLGVAIASIRSLRHGNFLRWFLVGVLIGISALARQTMLLYIPMVALALIFSWGISRDRRLVFRERTLYLAALALGVALILLPSTVRNMVVADDFVIVNSSGGMNLFMGNNPDSDGRWRAPQIGRGRVDNPEAMREAFRSVAEERMQKDLRPSEVSEYWMHQAIDFIFSEPRGWLALEARKFLLFINADEIWNNRSIEISRPSSFLLRLPLINLGMIMPLGLLGMALALGRWRALFPLYAVVAVYLSSVMIFFAVSRYRMPAIPILLIFSAYALVWFFEKVRTRSRSSLLGAGVALALLIPVTRLDLAAPDEFMAHFNLANRYWKKGDLELAEESYRIAIELNPVFNGSLNNLAMVYQQMGRDEDAMRLWELLRSRALARDDENLLERAERRLESLGAVRENPSSGPYD
jgi:tetratricopeptide (TPR) repeat protein